MDEAHSASPGDFLLRIRGTVQGVGFRPFIARLGREGGLRGWVYNDRKGVTIRLACTGRQAEDFASRIREDHPPASRIEAIRIDALSTGETVPAVSAFPPLPAHGFEILPSPEGKRAARAAVTADLALCPDCRRELLDPKDRRHLYPFINCTNCGPRYTIVRELPYDRKRTTMADFVMCEKCSAEYGDPMNRRYHAQPNACPECGPRLTALDADGSPGPDGQEALELAVRTLGEGKIVAVKGLGGFHLFVDASTEEAVYRLRMRKHRDEKPLAVMFSSLQQLLDHAEAGPEEIKLLKDTAAPIVLLRRRPESSLAESVAPENPWVGAILPYTPLHLLLMHSARRPLVATSGNLSEEPLCTDNEEAVRRLHGIADLFLVHDRPIARPVDDSVMRICRHGPIFLRRARGFAPAPISLPSGTRADSPMLSVGGHLKNTIALSMGAQVVISPHIGDLANSVSVAAFKRTVDLLSTLYGGGIDRVACDLHPDYASTRYAESLGLQVIPVQHHLAHLMACLLDNGIRTGQVLGVVWDGTGYGEDDTIWGGEFILADLDRRTARRVATLRPFQLPGGESAIRSTGRCALGALHAAGLMKTPGALDWVSIALGEEEKYMDQLVLAMERGLNSPVTSSAGRLFDAVAGLLGIAYRNFFEGQAAMALEFAADRGRIGATPVYQADIRPATAEGAPLMVDWSRMLEGICSSIRDGMSAPSVAYGFHASLARCIGKVAEQVGVHRIALSGGCFQNALLTDLSCARLEEAGHQVILHRKLSPNDNAISAGQAYASLLNITRCQPGPRAESP